MAKQRRPSTNALYLELGRANAETQIIRECFTAVLRGSLNLDHPHVSSDVDAVTHIDYWAVGLDRAHGGIVLAVRRVKQPDNQPQTVSVDCRYLDDIRARYHQGDLQHEGRLHYEHLMHATKQTL